MQKVPYGPWGSLGYGVQKRVRKIDVARVLPLTADPKA